MEQIVRSKSSLCSPNALFIEPYKICYQSLKTVFSSATAQPNDPPVTFCRKVVLLGKALLYCLPIINTIIHLVIQLLFKSKPIEIAPRVDPANQIVNKATTQPRSTLPFNFLKLPVVLQVLALTHLDGKTLLPFSRSYRASRALLTQSVLSVTFLNAEKLHAAFSSWTKEAISNGFSFTTSDLYRHIRDPKNYTEIVTSYKDEMVMVVDSLLSNPRVDPRIIISYLLTCLTTRNGKRFCFVLDKVISIVQKEEHNNESLLRDCGNLLFLVDVRRALELLSEQYYHSANQVAILDYGPLMKRGVDLTFTCFPEQIPIAIECIELITNPILKASLLDHIFSKTEHLSKIGNSKQAFIERTRKFAIESESQRLFGGASVGRNLLEAVNATATP